MNIEPPDLFPPLEVEHEWVTPLKDVVERLHSAVAVSKIASQGKPGVPYSVRRLPNGYELTNCNSGRIYVVSRDFLSCNCGDAAFRLRKDGCKHRRALRELMQQLEAARTPNTERTLEIGA